jgi:hypothetical protein
MIGALDNVKRITDRFSIVNVRVIGHVARGREAPDRIRIDICEPQIATGARRDAAGPKYGITPKG